MGKRDGQASEADELREMHCGGCGREFLLRATLRDQAVLGIRAGKLPHE